MVEEAAVHAFAPHQAHGARVAVGQDGLGARAAMACRRWAMSLRASSQVTGVNWPLLYAAALERREDARGW